jgi:hypothetical protein
MRALATILAVSILAIWSLATIIIDAVGRPSLSLASRVEADSDRDFSYLAKVGLGPMAQAGLNVCSRPAVRSIVSIRLAELDLAHRSGDAGMWASALADAGGLLREAIRCFPYDGNLWLRLAAVEFARTGSTADVEEMLALSASVAPSEAWIMRTRIVFASALMDTGSTRAHPILDSDIRAFVARGHYAEMGRLYLQVGDQSRQMIVDSIARLEPGERRSELERGIASALKTLPPERQP